MKRAVIDLGTNSTLLLIGELDEEHHVKSIHQEFEITRLGQSTAQSGLISKNAIERTIDVLDKYAAIINQYNIDRVHILGTQVLRITRNAVELVNLIREKFNWTVNILSQEQEAKFSYIGACDLISTGKREMVVIDIGGGSTEVIVGEKDQILTYRSLPLGVVSLGEKIALKEKLSQEDKQHLYDFIVKIFSEIDILKNKMNHIPVIGVGGTITTLAAVQQKMKHYQSHKINGYVLTSNSMHSLYEMLNKLTFQQRRAIPGITPGREDIIIYGILMFIVFLELFHLDKIMVSDRGLRFGYLKWIEINK